MSKNGKKWIALSAVAVMAFSVTAAAGEASTEQESAESRENLVFATSTFGQKFSPFFATTAYDMQVVDLTQESDIRDMIRNAKHDKRVTLDLDEVVFCVQEGDAMEKAVPFPFSMHYKERMRYGVPALFNFLKTKGYDIWVYSEKYYSMKYIRHYFAFHHTWVDGIVTGTARRHGFLEDVRKKLANALAEKYRQTLHIDNNSLICINNKTKAYEDYPLTGNPETWSHEIIKIVGALEEHEG